MPVSQARALELCRRFLARRSSCPAQEAAQLDELMGLISKMPLGEVQALTLALWGRRKVRGPNTTIGCLFQLREWLRLQS